MSRLTITPGSGGERSRSAVTKPVLTQRDLMCAYMPGVTEPCYLDRRESGTGLRLHGQAEPRRGDHGRQRSPHSGRHRAAGRQADDGGQERSLQALRRHRRLRPRAGYAGARRNSSGPCGFSSPPSAAICLEDIASPKCFFIEEELRSQMRIPVFHDKQHGTATVSAAALLNALELQEKEGRGSPSGDRRHRALPESAVPTSCSSWECVSRTS